MIELGGIRFHSGFVELYGPNSTWRGTMPIGKWYNIAVKVTEDGKVLFDNPEPSNEEFFRRR